MNLEVLTMEINDCAKCGSWALQALTQGTHLFYCHCFDGDCGNEGPQDRDSDASIVKWNGDNPRSPNKPSEKPHD